MKKKKVNDKVISYGFADPEMHKALRQHRHVIIQDKKKKGKKYACRTHNSAGSFYSEGNCTFTGFKKEQNPVPCDHPEFNCQLDPVPAISL